MRKGIVIILVLAVALAFFAAGCGENDGEASSSAGLPGSSAGTESTPSTSPSGSAAVGAAGDKTSVGAPADEEPARPEKFEDQIKRTIQATITMEDGGVIVLELYPDLAPQSVRNFVYLARDGFYDGLKFHRIMKGFMIQGGDPEASGYGNPGYSIFGEFTSNGFVNELKHTRGVLSMARGGNDPNSAGSQFFIMHSDSKGLDGDYAAFGKVVSGMDVVDKIADTPNSGANGAVAPENMPVMKSVTIDDDIELPEPEKLPRS